MSFLLLLSPHPTRDNQLNDLVQHFLHLAMIKAIYFIMGQASVLEPAPLKSCRLLKIGRRGDDIGAVLGEDRGPDTLGAARS